jgi:hypothetical protein
VAIRQAEPGGGRLAAIAPAIGHAAHVRAAMRCRVILPAAFEASRFLR